MGYVCSVSFRFEILLNTNIQNHEEVVHFKKLRDKFWGKLIIFIK